MTIGQSAMTAARAVQRVALVVWATLALVCPSDLLARVLIEIETEGDPGDGNEYGSGGGNADSAHTRDAKLIRVGEIDECRILIVPIWIDGKPYLTIEIVDVESVP